MIGSSDDPLNLGFRVWGLEASKKNIPIYQPLQPKKGESTRHLPGGYLGSEQVLVLLHLEDLLNDALHPFSNSPVAANTINTLVVQ